MMTKTIIEECAICGDQGVYGMAVKIGGGDASVCTRHGASTVAVYDAFNREYSKRARIYKNEKPSTEYTICLMSKRTYGGFHTSYKGRRNFKSLKTAIAKCEEFINN